MAQHDYFLDNAPGAAFRSDLNNALAAIATSNAGPTAPGSPFANMVWFDTTTNLLKMRNATNSAWITIASKSGNDWIPYRNGLALGTASVQPDERYAHRANNLSDLANADTARNNLGLGTAAVRAAEDTLTNGSNLPHGAAVKAYVDAQVAGTQWQYSPVFATTSGTAFDFTGIPEGVTDIEIIYRNLSLTGTNNFLVQIGNSGGFVTTGYQSGSHITGRGVSNSTSGFLIHASNATNRMYGRMFITRGEGGDWDQQHIGVEKREGLTSGGAGHVNITETMDRLRLTRTGTDSFDLGSFTVRYR